jgi:metal-dependent amidase/aminoacylase/carboxypeptidase family protein
VSREVAGSQIAVVTVGCIEAGTKANIIPDSASILVNVRSYDAAVRTQILSAIERIVRAEASASAAPRQPDFEKYDSAPTAVNDPAACQSTRAALASVGPVVDPGPVTGSEDVGVLATAADAPLVYWLLGGADPALFADAASIDEIAAVVAGLPSNHSPLYAPLPQPTLDNGVKALVAAARVWLD